jgi:hypothetical protein
MPPHTKALHRHLVSKTRPTQTPATGTAQLTYYLFEGVLVGFIDQAMIHVIAWSGGAGGSKKKSGPDGEVVNNPYLYAKKAVDSKTAHVHGGPIPPGPYQIYPPAQHAHLGLAAFLKPLRTLPNKRGGFYIHKQGPHGSDGCIVPEDASFADLMNKLKTSGGGSLHVLESMEGAFA